MLVDVLRGGRWVDPALLAAYAQSGLLLSLPKSSLSLGNTLFLVGVPEPSKVCDS